MISDEEIRALHRKYAQSTQSYDLVYQHCLIVQAVALELAEHYEGALDQKLVRAGSLLHDIGAYKLFNASDELIVDGNYIQHGILGEAILRAEGLSEAICRIASHHTGTGLTRQDLEAEHLPLPVADYLAETPEERLIMYADKFHSKSGLNTLQTFSVYRQFVTQFGQGAVERFDSMREEFGEPDYEMICTRFGLGLRES